MKPPGISVQWLKNHGVRVVTNGRRGRSERFAASDGFVTINEAASALRTYPVKIRRLIERKRLKAQRDPTTGWLVVSVADLKRLRATRAALEDQRKHRRVEA